MQSAISLILLLAVVFTGCVSVPSSGSPEGYADPVGERAAATALDMVGRPYRFKGESPAGFDCSGLVRYSYLTAGLDLPHSTRALREKSRPVSSSRIRKGDLVFFTQLGKKYSHVGIFIGGNRFVHAPSSGKKVRVDSLADSYWEKHFLGARRF